MVLDVCSCVTAGVGSGSVISAVGIGSFVGSGVASGVGSGSFVGSGVTSGVGSGSVISVCCHMCQNMIRHKLNVL